MKELGLLFNSKYVLEVVIGLLGEIVDSKEHRAEEKSKKWVK